ncbi:MAG: methionine--tRNA ligase [Halobacteriovoraceae bacterium]|nr:methionine--tRNA ligase [Halobacteriovoraceae bacterium]
MKKKLLVTSALPYANGPLHFGHLSGAYLPADVFVRHKRLSDVKTMYICGSDEHGVAIMLKANELKKDYRDYVNQWHENHKDLFKKYRVDFDFFGQTSKEYHAKEVKIWFGKLHSKGFIETKDEQQLFCNSCKNHLPDRFVEGKCYVCGYEKARGDECPDCGTWIESIKLIEPTCQICGSKEIEEVTVTQYYLMLSKYHNEYRQWLKDKQTSWRKTVFPYVESLTNENLHDRAITRDLDWGIDVPLDEAKGKKLYVWFDAPIGYVSNTKQYFEEKGIQEDYLKDWWQNPDTEIVNFIGKDNIIFHGVIFPMMSMASERVRPVDVVAASQFLNLNGKQFSKSTGNYVDAIEAFEKYGDDALRYYLLSISPETMDSSFTWEGMAAKVNGELANNIGNLVNRCLKFWEKNWKDGIDCQVIRDFSDREIAKKIQSKVNEFHNCLNNYEIKKGLETVMSMGHDVNLYFTEKEPWAVYKNDQAKASEIIAETGMAILILSVFLSPFIPTLSEKIQSHFSDVVTDDFKKAIYKGDFSIINSVFKNNLALNGTPQALVPKIELK